MTSLIIGSTAAKRWFPEWREPKDLDRWTDDRGPVGFTATREDLFWSDRFYDLPGVRRGIGRYATPDELFTIKRSHAFWELKNGSWSKHMADLLALKAHGAVEVPGWHDILYKVWELKHGPKVVDLTQESEEFFADAVKRVYDHDSIHRSVAFTPGLPVYERCLKDGKTVQIDMGKVWALPYEEQVHMFLEEIYVTALERLVIPSNYKHSAGAAYQWALRRTITSLTKGASARFIVDNFNVFQKPGIDYVSRHLAGRDFLIELGAK